MRSRRAISPRGAELPQPSLLALMLLPMFACGPRKNDVPGADPATAVGTHSVSAVPHSAGPHGAAPTSPLSPNQKSPSRRLTSMADYQRAGLLTIAEARTFMLLLVNRDRATQKLPPVALDDGAPTLAATRHSTDMASKGFLGHIGTDGSVPEERFAEAGGVGFVMENAACVVDESVRALDPRAREQHVPVVTAEDVEKTESMYFNEVPPNDGHRRNILRPSHVRVGIGIAVAMAPNEIVMPCITQEFVTDTIAWSSLPTVAPRNVPTAFKGVGRGIPVKGLGFVRLPDRKPMSVREANGVRSYLIPPPSEIFFPKGYKTRIPLKVSPDGTFEFTQVFDKPGRWEVSVWGPSSTAGELEMVGLHFFKVE